MARRAEQTGRSNQVSYASVALTARVTNTGVIPTGSFELSWRLDSADGPEIGRSSVDSIVTGGAREVAFTWDATGLPPGEWVQVYAVADDLEVVLEQDETDNSHSQSIMIPMTIPGDLDGDCDVDLADLAQLLSNYGTSSGMGYYDGDLDADGDVDLADLSALLAVYGTTCE